MASSANYNHHPLPAPPPQQDQYYAPYEQQQQAPADEDDQYPPQNYPPQQPQYQQPTRSQYQQQQAPQQGQQQRPPPPRAESSSQQQQSRVRPRSRAFSFRSDKSQKSANAHKTNLTETSAEKEAHRLHGKADPRMALNEREPGKHRLLSLFLPLLN